MDQATDPPRRYVRSLMRLSGRLRSPEIRLPMPASWTLWRAWICRQWHTCGMKTGSSHSPSLSGRPKSSPCDQRRLPLRDVVCDVAPASALRRALPGTSCLSLGIGEAMNDFRSTGVSAEGGGSDIGRKALWVIREFGLPAIVKAGVSCRSTRHHPTGKFCVNANGKLLDVWMLICCELCGRTSKIPIHERIYVQALGSERLGMFQDNDPAMVRDLAMNSTVRIRRRSR